MHTCLWAPHTPPSWIGIVLQPPQRAAIHIFTAATVNVWTMAAQDDGAETRQIKVRWIKTRDHRGDSWPHHSHSNRSFLFLSTLTFHHWPLFPSIQDVKQCWIYTLKGKENPPPLPHKRLFLTGKKKKNTNQVNNKMQSCLVVQIIIWPYVKLQAEAPGGTDICGDWLSEAASEVSDSI